MQSILEQITDWLKSMIISGIMGNLSGMFDSVNQQVGQIAGDVGTTPANFSPAVFSMIRNISESVILPIAGMVLTFIACYELIQMLIEHNNLANFETWTFFKWVFKTFLAVTLISNTFNITMAVFDVAQQVISRSGGLISGSTSVSDATPDSDAGHTGRHGLGTAAGTVFADICGSGHDAGIVGYHLCYRVWPNGGNISRVQKRRFSSKGGVRAFWEPGFSKPVKKSIKDVKSVTLASPDLPRRETTRGTIAYRKNRKLGKPSTHD